MSLRLGLRDASSLRLNSLPLRHLASFNAVSRRGRLVLPIPRSPPRRTFFGIRKHATASETATETAKSWGRICYRFTAYSTVFVVIAVTGFFLYDVEIPLIFKNPRSDSVVTDVSSKGPTQGLGDPSIGGESTKIWSEQLSCGRCPPR
jgi:hypothetical protein